MKDRCRFLWTTDGAAENNGASNACMDTNSHSCRVDFQGFVQARVSQTCGNTSPVTALLHSKDEPKGNVSDQNGH